MPPPADVNEFLELVRKSALIPDGRLDEVIERYRSTNALPQTIDAVSQLLIREGLLTIFQSKQLKLGRYKRFTIGSKYRLLELLGAGGMGAVYLCEHTLMKRLVALKVLPTDKLLDPSSLERFYREARAVAALNHPNIVRAHDIDQYDKLHFLVMEFVDGASLQEIVARHGPMDPQRVGHYIAQAAVGLQHAHELGMVHRDIKPGNLLLDRTGLIKILDMGLARFFNKAADNVTEKYDDKCVLGTADYLAPEQAVSNTVDIRADIYSLGGTMYFMLTGQLPFPENSVSLKLLAHQTKQPKPVTAFRKDVPAGLLSVLARMMEKDPAKRYQTPVEVAVALAEWGEMTLPPPPAREMPLLCPAVLALAGHNMEKSPANSAPLSRVLFGPGQAIFSRVPGPGSSSVPLVKSGGSSRVQTTAEPVASTASAAAVAVQPVEDEFAFSAPLSTDRASTTQTTPIPSLRRNDRHLRPQHAFAALSQVSSPVKWLILGLAGLSLFLAGALAVVLLTR